MEMVQKSAALSQITPIVEIAESIGLSDDDLELYGRYKAKVRLEAIRGRERRPGSRLILVSAMTPTPAGEGKTTVSIDYQPRARRSLDLIKDIGYDTLPVCIAKTQQSLSDNPSLLGRPKDFIVTVRDIKVASGAGFLIPITGEILRMPGLSKRPAAYNIDIDDDGTITGIT